MRDKTKILFYLNFSFIIFIINIITLSRIEFNGYVYSIYEFIPSHFWICSIAVFTISAIILFINPRVEHLNMYVFLVIIINNLIILSSPYLCGAKIMNCDDVLTLNGMVHDIYYYHKINYNINFYPVTHILTFILSSLSNIESINSLKLLAPIFTIISPLFYYNLTMLITKSIITSRISFMISSTFFLSSIFQPNSITTPNSLSLFFIPLIFYLLLRDKLIPATSICLMLMLSALTFFHPLTSIIISIFLFLYIFLDTRLKIYQFSKWITFYQVVFFMSYLIYLTKIWIRPVENLGNFMLGYKIPLGTAVDIENYIYKLDLYGLNLIEFFLKSYGHQAILLMLSFISVLIFLYKIRKDDCDKALLPIATFFILNIMLLSIQIFLPQVMNISFSRFLLYCLILSPVLSSIYFYYASLRFKNVIAIVIITILFINGLFVVYSSPHVLRTNTQVTGMDILGSIWIFNNKESNSDMCGYIFGYVKTMRIISSHMPYEDFLRRGFNWWSQIPDHFGYDKNNITIYEALGDNKYLILTKHDIFAYTELYKNINKLNFTDIIKLRNDHSAHSIYINGEYYIFYINRR